MSGLDLENDYVPRCRSCHIKYDDEARRNEESMSRWREGVEQYWTPEAREAQAVRQSTAWTDERKATHSAFMTEFRKKKREEKT